MIATDGQGEGIFRTPTDRGGGQHPRECPLVSRLPQCSHPDVTSVASVWDEEFRYKLYENAGVQNLTFKVMRKEGVRAKDEELIGTGSVPVDGRSWIEYDGTSDLSSRSALSFELTKVRISEWIELKTPEGKFAGELYVEMTFYPLESQVSRSS